MMKFYFILFEAVRARAHTHTQVSEVSRASSRYSNSLLRIGDEIKTRGASNLKEH
jgi:hypothetical protein